jgi:hypothetical protein
MFRLIKYLYNLFYNTYQWYIFITITNISPPGFIPASWRSSTAVSNLEE